MANQPENPVWETGIYQLEITDPVEGGVGGKSNEPLLQLANRTKFLYDLVKPHIPKFRGFISGLNPGETSGTKTVGGQLTSCVVNWGSAAENVTTYLVTLPATMGSTNYFVRITLEYGVVGTGSGVEHKRVYAPTFVAYSATQFFFTLTDEISTAFSNVKAHIEVISLD